MRSIEADFNDLAKDGLVRVLLSDVTGVALGERVTLVEESEGMSLEAELREIDANDGFAYFDLLWSSGSLLETLGGHMITWGGQEDYTPSAASSLLEHTGILLTA